MDLNVNNKGKIHMSDLPKIVKRGPTKKDILNAELERLEKEIQNLGSAVAESQIWHKRARIDAIKKELAALNTPAGKFNMGTDLLNQNMPQNMQVNTEQLSAVGAGRV